MKRKSLTLTLVLGVAISFIPKASAGIQVSLSWNIQSTSHGSTVFTLKVPQQNGRSLSCQIRSEPDNAVVTVLETYTNTPDRAVKEEAVAVRIDERVRLTKPTWSMLWGLEEGGQKSVEVPEDSVPSIDFIPACLAHEAGLTKEVLEMFAIYPRWHYLAPLKMWRMTGGLNTVCLVKFTDASTVSVNIQNSDINVLQAVYVTEKGIKEQHWAWLTFEEKEGLPPSVLADLNQNRPEIKEKGGPDMLKGFREFFWQLPPQFSSVLKVLQNPR